MVNPPELDGRIRQIIAEVLVVSLDDVQPGRALVRDLGAESLDFLDLVYRLEDVVGHRIPFPHWQRFLETILPDQDLTVAITPETIQQFAGQEAGVE